MSQPLFERKLHKETNALAVRELKREWTTATPDASLAPGDYSIMTYNVMIYNVMMTFLLPRVLKVDLEGTLPHPTPLRLPSLALGDFPTMTYLQ